MLPENDNRLSADTARRTFILYGKDEGHYSVSTLTREELDAKLEAVEARLETRLVSMEGKLDNLLNEVRHVGETAREAKQAASTIKWNVLFAMLGGVAISASVIVAMWAIGYQIADVMKPAKEPLPRIRIDQPSG